MCLVGDELKLPFGDLSHNFFAGLVTLITLYYIAEIHFPQCYKDVLTLMAKWVLDDQCYAIGKKATLMSAEICNVWSRIVIKK
jgi:hypothetical protein